MSAIARAIDDCRALTARMLEAAEAGDWQSVATLDAERRLCFQGVDVTAVPAQSLDSVLGEFRALMSLDGRLRDRARAAREGALDEVRKVRSAQHGRDRYRELAAPG